MKNKKEYNDAILKILTLPKKECNNAHALLKSTFPQFDIEKYDKYYSIYNRETRKQLHISYERGRDYRGDYYALLNKRGYNGGRVALRDKNGFMKYDKNGKYIYKHFLFFTEIAKIDFLNYLLTPDNNEKYYVFSTPFKQAINIIKSCNNDDKYNLRCVADYERAIKENERQKEYYLKRLQENEKRKRDALLNVYRKAVKK